MAMRSPNLDLLGTVAHALGDLLPEIVFVGGSVVELYVDDPAAPPVRNTEDVDCVIPVVRPAQMRDWEKRLRAHGFSNDMRQGAPLCRWICDGVTVDILAPDSSVMGFTNRWYASGLQHSIVHKLSGTNIEIRLFDFPWFLAAKMEAVRSRGWPDLRMSHDFEDVVYLWNNIPQVMSRLESVPEELKEWIAAELADWRRNPSFHEAVECALSAGEEVRAARIIQEMTALSKR